MIFIFRLRHRNGEVPETHNDVYIVTHPPQRSNAQYFPLCFLLFTINGLTYAAKNTIIILVYDLYTYIYYYGEYMLNRRRSYGKIAWLLIAMLFLQSCSLIIINDPTADGSDPTATGDSFETVQPADPTLGYVPPKVDSDKAHRAYAAAYLKSVADNGYDLNGATVFISAPYESVMGDDSQPDVYSRAKYERNKAVEEALGIRIATTLSDAGTLFDALQSSVKADEYFADLILLQQKDIGTFAAANLLFNLRSAPFLDLSQPYFDSASVSAATAGHKTYAVAGPASFEETSLSAVYFNRSMMEWNGLPLPYTSVYNGTWTWDEFFRYCAAVSDINGSTDTRVYSYSTQYAAPYTPSNVFFSCGGTFVNSQAGSTPKIAFSKDNSDEAGVITRLYTDLNRNRDTENGLNQFYTGQSMFLLDRLYLMSWIPNCEDDWGILPMPKLNEEQKAYVSLTDESALFFAMQKNTVSAETASVVLSALNAASYGVLTDAYIDLALRDMLRDNDSANMLEIIAHSRTYDFALAFGPANDSLVSATVGGMIDLADGNKFSSICGRIGEADKQLASKYAAN